MRDLQQFSDLVQNVCKRRHMYVCGGSFYEVCAYLLGYASAVEPCPFGKDHHVSFNAFVNIRFGYPHNLAWPYVLKTAMQSDEQATEMLRVLLSEYINATRDGHLNQLIEEARGELETRVQDQPEQVACWRQFSRAYHRGDEAVLKRLILEHVDAPALWASAYPDDVIALMDEIQESYAIPVVSVSADGVKSQIMSPNFGLIMLEKVDGNWKINAEPIIRCRLAVDGRNEA